MYRLDRPVKDIGFVNNDMEGGITDKGRLMPFSKIPKDQQRC